MCLTIQMLTELVDVVKASVNKRQYRRRIKKRAEMKEYEYGFYTHRVRHSSRGLNEDIVRAISKCKEEPDG